MAEDDKHASTLVSSLSDALKLAVDWLKFAEAKNAALIGLNVAAIIGIERVGQHLWLWSKVAALLLFIASSIIALLAVLPKVGWKFKQAARPKTESEPNLLFYGDVGLLTVDAYIKALEHEIGSALAKPDRWIAMQVAGVSHIALFKLKLFKFAAFSTIAGVLAVPVLQIACLVFAQGSN